MHLATGSRAPADRPPAVSGMTQCGRSHNTLRQAAQTAWASTRRQRASTSAKHTCTGAGAAGHLRVHGQAAECGLKVGGRAQATAAADAHAHLRLVRARERDAACTTTGQAHTFNPINFPL